jgi:hypothetical protein
VGADKHLIRGFEHLAGHHCGSTALRDLCHYYGHPLPEALCFGLGSGIGFFYTTREHADRDISPSRLFGGRTATLESDFFSNLGVPFAWHTGDEFPWHVMRQWVDSDVPVLITCDLKYLGYYQTSTHFSGHVVVLAGYNDATVYLADTHFRGLQPAPLSDLENAMVSQHFPIPVRNQWTEIVPFDVADLGVAGRRAIARAAHNMLAPEEAFSGVEGMRRLASDFPNWREAADLSWCARFGYQVIEKRGTGGGHFRRLYAGFLEEIGSHIPQVVQVDAAARARASARLWTELSDVLREISENEDVALLTPAADLARRIADAEESLFRDLARVV